MVRNSLVLSLLMLLLSGCVRLSALAPVTPQEEAAAEDAAAAPLRVIAFGAHPDDSEIKAGGVGALWARRGAQVKFVSTTNGDIGHWEMAGGPLARRRLAEVQAAARTLGIAETEVLDIHDGEILPTLENRRKITRRIRDWKAQVVLAHRPNDYHPDHRYTGVLVQDAAYMVTVPFFCPDTPHLTENPVFLYYSDGFEKPNPFDPDIVVSIDPVIDEKLEALVDMESQFVEGGANGHAGLIAEGPGGRDARREEVRRGFARRFAATADAYRDKLIELYGEETGRAVEHAEAFEVCEYGRQPSAEELRRLFPID